MKEKIRTNLSKTLIVLCFMTVIAANVVAEPITVDEAKREVETSALKEGAWEVVRPGTPVPDFHDIYVKNEEEAWVVGAHNTISHTKDGGKSWITKTIGEGKRSLNGITFVNQSSGWVVGSGGIILHTEDGGENWSQQKSGANSSLKAVTFVSPKEGWAVGSNGAILHTEDGGENWVRQVSSTDNALSDVSFINSNSGWVVGNKGTVLHTEDGGESWTPQESGVAFNLLGVTFVDAREGWAVGWMGIIIHTEDGGENWTRQAGGMGLAGPSRDEHVFAVTFFDSNVGWAVGGWSGMILHTEDGGENWTRQDYGTNALHAVGFANTRFGWAVGYGGIIVHTEDGGITWTPQTVPPIDKGWNEVDFFGLSGAAFFCQKGWAVGNQGIIVHTDDGGESWTSQFSGDRYLHDVDFVSPNESFAVGSFGAILHTNDGGESWMRQHSPAGWYWLRAADFVSSQEGWIVGDYSAILHTDDGGESWILQESGVNARWLWEVDFVNPIRINLSARLCESCEERSNRKARKVFKHNVTDKEQVLEHWSTGVARNEAIKHWSTGAPTPQRPNAPLPRGTDDTLSGVVFLNPKEGWVVGDNGTILHTIDGGKKWTLQESGVVNLLSAICYDGENNLFAVGEGEIILRLTLGISVIALEEKIANPGDKFTANISVLSAEALHSFSFDLAFNPSVLRAVSVKEGPFLSRDGADATSWQTPTIDNKNGVISNIRCSRRGKDGVGEKGILAIVTFEALDMGGTDLTLQNLRLLSPTGEEMKAFARKGKVDVYPHGSISGMVLDAASNKPIKGAKVEVSKDNFTFGIWTYSADDGTYTLDGVPISDFDVTASKADYISETISKVRVEQGKNTKDIDIKITSFETASTITIPTPIGVGETAPDFTLQDIDGKQVSLSEIIGKPIILSFWDSNSEHCRRQIPHLDALYKKYRGDGLVVIGINKEFDHTAVLEFAKSQISYIVLLDGEEIFQRYGVSGIPCTYYIDKAGKVRYREVGFPSGGEVQIEQKIKELLEGN